MLGIFLPLRAMKIVPNSLALIQYKSGLIAEEKDIVQRC